MRIHTYGQHVDVSPALRTYIEDKLRRIEPHVDAHCEVNVRLEIEHSLHHAVVIVNLNKRILYTCASAPSMYIAIDRITDKLNRLVVKQKEKKIQRRYRETRALMSMH